MRIVIFTENTYCGGLDSFLVTLVDHWPGDDEMVLVCNRAHPGLEVIRQRVRRPLTVVAHDIRPVADRLDRIRRLPLGRVAAKLLSPFLRFAGFPLLVRRVGRLLAEVGGDRLMVVNGGYPGGDSCRAATIAWRRLGRPAPLHNVHNLAVPPRWWERWPEGMIDRAVAARARCFVAVSRAAADALAVRPALRGAPRRVIANGIPAPDDGVAADPRPSLGVPEGAPYVVMLGTYEPRKGHAFLFAAFRRVLAEVPDAHLVVCGFGYPADLARVEALAAEAGLAGSVHLLGFRSDGAAIIGHAHALAVASQAFESFGLTAVEAMARGVPVVATRIGGLPEVVGEDGSAGFCVAADDQAGFAAALVRLLRQPELRARMGAAGRDRYRQCFTAGRMAAEYRDLLMERTG